MKKSIANGSSPPTRLYQRRGPRAAESPLSPETSLTWEERWPTPSESLKIAAGSESSTRTTSFTSVTSSTEQLEGPKITLPFGVDTLLQGAKWPFNPNAPPFVPARLRPGATVAREVPGSPMSTASFDFLGAPGAPHAPRARQDHHDGAKKPHSLFDDTAHEMMPPVPRVRYSPPPRFGPCGPPPGHPTWNQPPVFVKKEVVRRVVLVDNHHEPISCSYSHYRGRNFRGRRDFAEWRLPQAIHVFRSSLDEILDLGAVIHGPNNVQAREAIQGILAEAGIGLTRRF